MEQEQPQPKVQRTLPELPTDTAGKMKMMHALAEALLARLDVPKQNATGTGYSRAQRLAALKTIAKAYQNEDLEIYGPEGLLNKYKSRSQNSAAAQKVNKAKFFGTRNQKDQKQIEFGTAYERIQEQIKELKELLNARARAEFGELFYKKLREPSTDLLEKLRDTEDINAKIKLRKEAKKEENKAKRSEEAIKKRKLEANKYQVRFSDVLKSLGEEYKEELGKVLSKEKEKEGEKTYAPVKVKQLRVTRIPTAKMQELQGKTEEELQKELEQFIETLQYTRPSALQEKEDEIKALKQQMEELKKARKEEAESTPPQKEEEGTPPKKETKGKPPTGKGKGKT